MPYDEDGNYIPEEDDPEGSAVESQSPNFNADIAEYIRRQGLQSQMASSGGGSSPPSSYSPAAIGPEEEKYRSLEKQTPLKQNFHPSKLRSVLSTAAGIGTGVIFGPSAGQHVYDIARNSQYNHAQGDFQQKLGVQEAAAKEEENATQRAAVQGHLGAQSAAEVSRRKAEEARGNRYNWMISPEGQKFELDKTKLQHPGTTKAEEGPYEAELNDGSKVDLVRTPTGLWKNPEDGTIISRSAIKQISEKGKSIKSSSPFTGPLKEDIAATQVVSEETAKPGTHAPFEVDGAKLYLKARARNQQPNDAFNEVVRTMEDEGKGKGKDGKLTSDQMIRLRNMMPEQRLPQAPPMVDPDAGNKLIQPKVGDVVPPKAVTPQQFGATNEGTVTTRTMKETAPKVIALADKVLAEVEEQKSSLGPSASRWNEFWAGKVGAPNPEFTKLRVNAGLLQTLLMRMHVGASGRVALLQHFQDLMDYSKQSPENMAAAIGEIKDYAQGVGGLKPKEGTTPQGSNLPKIGETFEGSKVKSIKQIK